MSDAWSGIYMKINERTALINFWSFGLVKWKSILKELSKKGHTKKKSHNNDVGNIENRTDWASFCMQDAAQFYTFQAHFQIALLSYYEVKRE